MNMSNFVPTTFNGKTTCLLWGAKPKSICTIAYCPISRDFGVPRTCFRLLYVTHSMGNNFCFFGGGKLKSNSTLAYSLYPGTLVPQEKGFDFYTHHFWWEIVLFGFRVRLTLNCTLACSPLARDAGTSRNIFRHLYLPHSVGNTSCLLFGAKPKSHGIFA